MAHLVTLRLTFFFQINTMICLGPLRGRRMPSPRLPAMHSRDRELETILHHKVVDRTHDRPRVNGAVGALLREAGPRDGPVRSSNKRMVHEDRV